MKTYQFLLFIIFLVLARPLTMAGQGLDGLYMKGTDGAFEKRITLERKPAPLPGVREADVTWSKIVWRMIDLRERMNQQFYFPTRDMQGRSNLINLLMKGIEKNMITAFDASQDDNEFVTPLSYDQVKSQFGASSKVVQRRNFETGQLEDVTIQVDISTDEVKQLIIKEVWYFDKQKSTMQVRILGLCPIRMFYREEDKLQENVLRKKLFWVSYPEVRTLLAKNESLNAFNGARNLSFDDLFLIRRFDGYIVREENVYNNREILSYASGENASSESDRVKDAIFNYEQDLWEY